MRAESHPWNQSNQHQLSSASSSTTCRGSKTHAQGTTALEPPDRQQVASQPALTIKSGGTPKSAGGRCCPAPSRRAHSPPAGGSIGSPGAWVRQLPANCWNSSICPRRLLTRSVAIREGCGATSTWPSASLLSPRSSLSTSPRPPSIYQPPSALGRHQEARRGGPSVLVTTQNLDGTDVNKNQTSQ